MRRTFLLPAFILFFIALVSQEKRGIDHIGVEEGLSQGTTFDIVQDNEGFIWIATADGLNRFDGYNFKVFKNDPSDSSSFKHTSMRNLFKGKNALWASTSGSMELYRMDLFTQKIKKVFTFVAANGVGEVYPFKEEADTVWVIANNYGVVKLNSRTGKIIQQFPQAGDTSPTNNITAFDSTSSLLWYASNDATELYSFSLRTNEISHRSFIDKESKEKRFIHSLTISADHKIMLGSRNIILSYDPLTGNYLQYPFINPSEPNTIEKVSSLKETGDNQLWCGTETGAVYLFDQTEKKFSLESDPADNNGNTTPHRTIKFMMDKTKNLWVGTDPDGLYKIDTKKKPFHHTFNDPQNKNGLQSNFIKCFTQRGDELFIGTHDKCINVFNLENGTCRYINGFNNTTDNLPVICGMVQDSSGRIWVSTSQGIGIIEKNDTYLVRPNVTGKNEKILDLSYAIHILPDQSLLVGTGYELLELKKTGDVYQAISFPITDLIEDFLTDRSGNLWVCSTKGIYFSEKNSGPENLKVVLNIGRIKSIYEDDKGIIWAGSVSGLYKIDPVQKRIIRTYSEKDGMPNNFVYGIVNDEKNNLWLSTNKGISKFDPVNETFRNYTVTDGLQSNEFNTGAYYRNPAGELFFGGVNGFNYFYPEAIKDNPFAPQSVIIGLKIFDKPFLSDSCIENTKHITLDYTLNNLLLEYTALEFSDPSKNKFKYRLKGLDTNWVNADKEQFARFVNLSPGEYVFQLKAANNDGLWNEQPTELRITITPPFWKTLPFILSVIAIGIVLSFLSIRFYLRRQLKIRTKELELKQSVRMNAIIETEEKERKRIAGELHDGLGQLLSTARLNIAGFEDNTEGKDSILLKNSLQLLDEACAEVRTISHNMMPGALIRLGLMEAVNELINKINDTEKLKIVYDTNLEERFPETIEIALYRIIQEVLNNMVRHAQAKNIVVKMEKSKAHLEITIADDGKSFDVAEIPNSEGLGWKNIYSRVEILNGEINVTSEKGKGTTIFITVPLN